MPSNAFRPIAAEALIRQLRTVLDETRGVLRLGGPGETLLVLDERIECLQRQAQELAPNFPGTSVRNGLSPG